jgi:hypothetical protein
MKWTPATVTASVLLLVVTVACVCWLPNEHAWAMLGQITAGAVKGVFG